ncbi:radical sam [Lucifera butyrica]|uniref:Radical sam n=1 Tax=Lucifera butyrica TaxID=1351585 RepID=A0A498RA46_9FIRM|nr:radical SAM protein [Lucifera butyrica]VBB07003.1 radical sam [Lucifera butyrica]
MISVLSDCRLCPRRCRVNRTRAEKGYCGAGVLPKIALVSLHHGEEPCLSGSGGAGTVFFSHCNLHCHFCQNHKISQEGYGREVSIDRLAEIFCEQEQRGAHNVSLVTPTQFTPQIIEALRTAKQQGFSLPVVYNTNGYETVETVEMLGPWVDIFLPDLKYAANDYSITYSEGPGYFHYASRAIAKMVELTGPPRFDDQGIMQKGVIVRHLVLPGLRKDSQRILDWLWQTFGHTVYISLMNQYTPLYNAGQHQELNRTVTTREYDRLIEYALTLGIENAFIQEGRATGSQFVPSFNLAGVLNPAEGHPTLTGP